MLKGIDVSQRINFISEFDKTEPKTVFVLKPLSGIEYLNANGDNALVKLLSASIQEIKNFDGAKDKNKIIESLPTNVFNELLGEVNKLNLVTDDDKKKLTIAIFHECDEDCKEYSDKDHPIPNRWKIGEFVFSRCPLTFADRNVLLWTKAYRFYEKGLLPNEKGWLQQTNKYISIMNYMDGIIAQHKREQNAKK